MFNSTNLPLEKRKIVKKTIERFPIYLLAIFISGSLIAFSVVALELNLWWLWLIAILILILPVITIYIYETFYYKYYFYDFKEDGAEIRKGVISRSTGHVRYERIQNIFIDQDIFDRIFGLYDVHYETAGETSGVYSHVDGLNKENSNKLVEFLNHQIYRKNNNDNQSTTRPLESDSKKEISEPTGEIIDRTNAPISSKIIIKDSIVKFFYIIFVFFIFGSSFFRDDAGFTLTIKSFTIFITIAIIVAVIGSLVYEKIWYKNFYFQFSDKSGIIKSQVIALSSTYVYYDRIQNINLTQGILERLFGLFSVTIETAAESNKKNNEKSGLEIPGLLKDDAEKIKTFLLAKVERFKNKL